VVFPLRVVALARIIPTAKTAETAEFFSQILSFFGRFARFAVKAAAHAKSRRKT